MKQIWIALIGWVMCTQVAMASNVAVGNEIDWIEMHGPEKPPPDDGYTFKGAKGGNALGKLGLAAMGAGVVTTVLFLSADKDSERRDTMGRTTVGLLGGGFALLLIERAT